MERKIGEIFEYEGTTLQVVESELCEYCFFYRSDNCNIDSLDKTGNCCIRHDHNRVIFKEL